MDIKLKEISLNKKNILDNLIQLYLHDISLDFPIDFDSSTGLYKYDNIKKYFKNENNKAFFILNNKEIVGFILLDFSIDKIIIQEMFILNNYRRMGIGKIAVNLIFDKFKGIWEIKSLPCSINAERFWTSTIKEYTNNNFERQYIGKYNRAVFTFNNKND